MEELNSQSWVLFDKKIWESNSDIKNSQYNDERFSVLCVQQNEILQKRSSNLNKCYKNVQSIGKEYQQFIQRVF